MYHSPASATSTRAATNINRGDGAEGPDVFFVAVRFDGRMGRLPESVAAIGAARKNDLQKSINLALGSSLATIGLTIPAVAVAAYALDKTLILGLGDRDIVLLLLTFLLSMLTFGTGRTNILFGLVHLVVFAVFVFLVFVP